MADNFEFYRADTYGSGSFSAKPIGGDPFSNAALGTIGRNGQMILPYKCRVDPECTRASEVLAQIQAHNAMAMPGDLFPDDDDWVVARISPKHVNTDDQTFWQVDVTLEPDPLKIPDDVQTQATHYTEVIYKDEKTGKVFENTAGVKFEKGLEESRGRARLEITRNLSVQQAPDPTAFAQILFHKNFSPVRFLWKGKWHSYAMETLYCTDVRAPFIEEPAPYHRVTSVFEIDLKRWVRHPLNAGYDEKNTTNNKFAAILDDKGRATGRVYLLGSDGKKLKQGYDPIFLDCETIPICDFSIYHLFPGT